MTDRPEFFKMLLLGSVEFEAVHGGIVKLKVFAISDGSIQLRLVPEQYNVRDPEVALSMAAFDGFALADLITRAAEAAADALGDSGCPNCGEHHDAEPQLPLDLPEDFTAAVQKMIDEEAGEH